jgi:hypothetical protein
MHLLVSTHSTPIAVVKIDSSRAVNRLHATQFWETVLSTLAGFIECGNGSDLQMGASTLHVSSTCHQGNFKGALPGTVLHLKPPPIYALHRMIAFVPGLGSLSVMQ